MVFHWYLRNITENGLRKKPGLYLKVLEHFCFIILNDSVQVDACRFHVRVEIKPLVDSNTTVLYYLFC